jgi:hypothetical protein
VGREGLLSGGVGSTLEVVVFSFEFGELGRHGVG